MTWSIYILSKKNASANFTKWIINPKNVIGPAPYYYAIQQIKMKYLLASPALTVTWHVWACLMAGMTVRWTNQAITRINLQSVNCRHRTTTGLCMEKRYTSSSGCSGGKAGHESRSVWSKSIPGDGWYLFLPTSMHVVCTFYFLIFLKQTLTLSAPSHPLSLAGTVFEWEM